MDPERRQNLASQGGRASQKGRRGKEEDWDEVEDYEKTGFKGDEDRDDGDHGGNRRKAFGSRVSREERRIGNTDIHYSGRSSNYNDREGGDGRSSSPDGRSSSSGRKGFAAIDPQEKRKITAKGGRAGFGSGRARGS